MEEKIVSKKVAFLAMMKGFIEDCYYHYNLDSNLLLENSVYGKQIVATHHLLANTYDFHTERWGGGNKNSIAAPTQSHLQKWLRDKHNIHITTYIWCPDGKNRFDSDVISDLVEDTKESNTEFMSYEESLEDALLEALNLLPDEKV